MRNTLKALKRKTRLLWPLAALIACRNKTEPLDPQSVELSKLLVGGLQQRSGAAYSLPYRLYIPKAYSANRRYPLVLYLHGGGAWGTDNIRQLNNHVAELVSEQRQAKEPFFIFVPQCAPGDEWVNRHDSAPYHNYDQAKVKESLASELVFEALAQLQSKYAIDEKRLYITGYSMGGSGTWDFITRHPGIFAAAVPVTGVGPNRVDGIAQLPIWAFHGAGDTVSPASNTRETVARLKQLGSKVRYTELPGVGHDSDRFVYFDAAVFDWLFAQRKP